jgi:hypothetical protein
VDGRKEQDVERVFNDCAVMAICKSFGNVTERWELSDRSTIGVEGTHAPKVSLSSISSISDQTSSALNHG